MGIDDRSSEAVLAAEVRIHQRVAHFRVLERIGRGGMGVVYRARDEKLGRDVALKVLPPSFASDDERRRRMLREARAAAAVTHPNIVTVYEVGETESGQIYIAMELVSGESLRARLERGPLTVPEALGVARDVARGLAEAHGAGLVHRDLKPDNIMIGRDGHAKILDFGLAKTAVDETESALAVAETMSRVTETGAIVGTLAYMSPEQAKGKPVDARSDVFSFGMVVYEMLAGRRPFGGESAAELIIAIDRDEPPPLRGVPGAFAAFVSRCMRKSASDRFVSGAAALAALERVEVRGASRGRAIVLVALAAIGVVVALTVTITARRAPAALQGAAVSLTPAPSAPHTSSAEALAAFNDALVARHDGQVDTERKLLGTAVAADPTFAAAHLRLAYALLTQRTGSMTSARAHAEVARRGRADLSPRDAAILDALEPAFTRDPPAFGEAWKRLHQAAAASPDDAHLAMTEGEIAFAADRNRDADVALKHALDLDPTFIMARVVRATVLRTLGERDDSDREVSSCADSSSPSSACLLQRMFFERGEGRCEAMAKDARAVSMMESNAFRGWSFEAEARASRGASIAEVTELVRQGLARAPDDVKLRLGARYDVSLAILGGRFDDALSAVRRMEEQNAGSDEASTHLTTAKLLVYLQTDMGDLAAAARTASDTRARSGAWGSIRWINDDLRPGLLRVEARDGRVTREEVRRLLDQWEAEWRERIGDDAGPDAPWQRWAVVRAAGVETKEEAEEALALAPRTEPAGLGQWPTRYALGYGRVLLRAGRAADAVPWLRMAANDCDEAQVTFDVFGARLDLGDALVATGDAPAACDAWREIVFRWGKATPRSITAEAVRARMKANGCPAETP